MPEMKPLTIKRCHVDRDLCIGAATCAVIAGKTFKMDDENKAVVLEGEWDDPETILMGAESCPTKAIFLYDENDEQIYPQE
jgi:ferredoxin